MNIKQSLINSFFLLLFWSLPHLSIGQNFKSARPADFPTPPQTKNRLFFLQRNLNANTVIYDLNRLPSGKIDPSDPLDVFYISYSKEGQRTELKWVERQFAYGYSSDYLKSQDEYIVHLVAYKKRKIHLKKQGNQYVPMMDINGKECILTHLFIQADESGLWPEVQFVEIFGKDPVTGKVVFEKILV